MFFSPAIRLPFFQLEHIGAMTDMIFVCFVCGLDRRFHELVPVLIVNAAPRNSAARGQSCVVRMSCSLESTWLLHRPDYADAIRR